MTVSVVIPTYNRLPFLLEALETVRRQTYPADEIIVVDDGSTDGTEIAFQTPPAGVRYIRQKNAGPAAARNYGMHEAKCDWIAFLDSDDLWLPNKLATQKAFLEQHPGVEFLFAHMVLGSSTSEAEGAEILNPAVHAYCQKHAGDLREFVNHLVWVNPVPTSSVLFTKAAMKRIGLMREDLHCAEDYEWWLRWALAAHCGFLDEIVVKRRIHRHNIIGDRLLMLESSLKVLIDLADRDTGSPVLQQGTLQKAICHGRYSLASEYYRRANYKGTADLLQRVDPRRLGSKVLALKCLVKFAASSILGLIHS